MQGRKLWLPRTLWNDWVDRAATGKRRRLNLQNGVLVSSTSPWPLRGSPEMSEELEKKITPASEVSGAGPDALKEAIAPVEIWYACGVQ